MKKVYRPPGKYQLAHLTPRVFRTRSFRELQTQWYGKLRDRGFRDIEEGGDVGLQKAYRGDGKRGRREIPVHTEEGDVDVAGMMAWNADVFGTYTNLADTPTAVAWRNISKAAHDLPETYRGRLFLIDLAQVGCLAGYLLKRHKMTWRDAHWTFHRFLEDARLVGYKGILVNGPTKEDVGDLQSEAMSVNAARELRQAGVLTEEEYQRYRWSRGLS